MGLLEDAKLKIEWAKRKIPDIQTAIEAFLASKPYGHRAEPQPDGRRSAIVVRATKPIPGDINLLVGDIVHNLRASLDYSACCLAEANGASSTKDVYFPFGADIHAFEASAKEKIKKLSVRAQDFIRALKPYNGGKIFCGPFTISTSVTNIGDSRKLGRPISCRRCSSKISSRMATQRSVRYPAGNLWTKA